MKKSFGLLLVLLLACMFPFAACAGEGDVKIDEEHFPDPVFRKEVEQYDLDHDGILSPEEADNATKIKVRGEGVFSLDGIEYLSGLEELFCNDNNLTKLDISRNTELKTLNCSSNNLTELDVSQTSGLKFLYCDSNHLAALDVSRNPKLQMLSCSDNPLNKLDTSNLSRLVYLYVADCELTKLDLSNNHDLVELHCRGNRLTELDLSNNPFIDLLPCDGNKLTALDISNCPYLLALMEIVDPSEDTDRLIWEIKRDTSDNHLYNACLVTNKNVVLYTGKNADPGVPIDAQHFPEEAFREQVKKYDLNDNEFLSSNEANIATIIDVSEKNISSLSGIEYLTGLRQLYCEQNNLTELDLRSNTKLTLLFCNNNKLRELDLKQNIELETIMCSENNLTSLDVSGNPGIERLYCHENQLTQLDIRHCPVILDLVKHRNPDIAVNDLYWLDEEYIHGSHYTYALLIDKNVQLYTGTESVQ
ncbi:MAG: hypothetical protein IKZ98_00480 [Clostridia bacterium]|nr:hypothetical protein [Clostridia bacterium]